ncbi:MAG: hypothetical protein NTW10_02850 [Bacteroidetes bacterium]|nr:hypothetical protein [Bacteroidota bacterium]
MKKILFLMVLLFFQITGCQSILKMHYGITDPKAESAESLTRFLKKHHYPVENFYVFKDSTSYIKMVKDPHLKKYILSTMIINPDFKKIATDSARCQWSGGYFVDHLKKDTVYQFDTFIDIEKLFSEIVAVPDPSTKLPVRGEFDFLVINTWAKFIGKMNERLFETIPSAQKRKDLRILVINLNVDIQKSWNMTKSRIKKL